MEALKWRILSQVLQGIMWVDWDNAGRTTEARRHRVFMSGRIGETETKNLEFSHRGHRGHGDKEKSLFVLKDKNSVLSVNSVARKNFLSVSLCLCGFVSHKDV